jgi:hypothetical protein
MQKNKFLNSSLLNTKLSQYPKSDKSNFEIFKDVLFINKFFLSPNHMVIDIDATHHDNSGSEIKQCWDNKIKKIHIDSNQTTYLPISNEMKLYFKKADENITCVYAISKNQYNYRLQEIGHINTQQRRDFENSITKDKR